MTRSLVFASSFAAGLASQAVAHEAGPLHAHPHDGASWLTLASALGLVALAVAVWSRRK